MVSPHAAEGARFLSQGRYDDAIRSFRAGLAASPRDLECHLGLARAYLTQMNLPEAKKVLEKLLAIEPRHLEAQSHLALLEANEGDDRALELLQRISNRPEAGFFEHFNLASALTQRGNDEGAEAAYEKAVKAQPRGAHAWFELGMISQRKGDLDKAIERFQKAAELAPSSHYPLLMLSRARTVRGEVGKAVEALKKAILIAPKEEILYEDLYKLCFAAGATDGALTAAKALRQLDPKNGNYAYMQGVAQLTSGQVADARGTLKEAMELAPGAWEVKHALAKAHQIVEELPEAVKLLEEAHKMAPAEPDPANDLALLYLAEAKAAAAVKVLEPVLQAHPEHAGAHLNMALAQARLDPAKAIQHAHKAQAAQDQDVAEQARKLLKKLQGG